MLPKPPFQPKIAASVGCILLPINTMLEESESGVSFKAGVGVRVGLKITDSASPGSKQVYWKYGGFWDLLLGELGQMKRDIPMKHSLTDSWNPGSF